MFTLCDVKYQAKMLCPLKMRCYDDFMPQIRSISDLLLDLKTDLTADKVSVDMIVESLHERGFGVLMFFFAIPIALPFPVPPGVNVAFATPLAILAAQLMVGRDIVWMPKTIGRRGLSRGKLHGVIDLCVPWLRRLEILVRPRLGVMTRGGAANIVGLLALIMSISIYIPIPLTNTVPGMGICAMAAGLIMRDGLLLLIGAIVGSLWVAMVFFVFFFFGMEGFALIKDVVLGFFS